MKMNQDPTTLMDPSVTTSSFVSRPADRSLRVTCYGSSSAKTPEAYLREAHSLGYILAKRGHICVNGAGSFGCMAAMNDGAVAGNGHIVGVIHEMFLVDNGYGGRKIDRDGGSHEAFKNVQSSSHMPLKKEERTGPIREIQVAGGMDLQERKKLLVQNADGLVVLPGGPGTWDELWEMSCARHLGLIDLPIVCVNVNGYYEPFREMLQRAHKDELIKLLPEQIVHFADSAEEAVRWIELERARAPQPSQKKAMHNRTLELNRSSFMLSGIGIFERLSRAPSFVIEESSRYLGLDDLTWRSKLAATFLLGLGCGVAATYGYFRQR